MNPSPKATVSRRGRLFREVTRAIGRRPHQRACPLPLAFAAIAIPFLAAWATASPPQRSAGAAEPLAVGPLAAGARAAGSKEAPAALDPWAMLDRARRQAPEAGTYVDLYGPLEPWEERLMAEQGYRPPGR